MSNIFIDKGAFKTSSGTYYSPTYNFKVKSNNDYWHERKRLTQTIGDSFFKKSERYKMNPDFSPKHVGMRWSIIDAGDYIKPTAAQKQQMFA